MCGFSNALAFTEINDDDIDYIENSIHIQSVAAAENDDHLIANMNIADFFGKSYVN